MAAGLVIVALTAAAFWLSYAHLAEVALANGMESKVIRAWAWPATLDLFIVAGELLMLRAALAGRVDGWAIGLTVVGSVSSIALNVAGVGTAAGTLDYVVAAVPPTAALLAFGALMRQIHQALAERLDAPAVTAEVTVERVDDDQPRALPVAPEVVPAGARMLPIVARPEVTTIEPRRQFRLDHFAERYVPVEQPAQAVIPAAATLTAAPFLWDAVSPPKVTTAVPAASTRQVVTAPVTLTPSDLRREARRLNREAVRSTKRPVTIQTLQDELGLSRRDATELRREVVRPVAP
jgi:hypothetical protein